MMWERVKLLKRVVQLVFDQNVVTAYHNCATSGEISVEEMKRQSSANAHNARCSA